ncbi:hypothetical protein JG688_00018568 [Phytophthora aleatoria]|uniref:DDE-1 domain-containing protein n=1 Tax=Phytophthora aleatoria TaxID=2496075 RepID=A0A8J5I1N2_9STRA|nr:hypothetical protein JG688_00018568 [Phytophthora aleatoria]
MLLADWEGTKLPTFPVFKIAPSKIKEKRVENYTLCHGFSPTMWDREIRPLQERHDCQIYSNQRAWWNSYLSVIFFKFHFANRPNPGENILLIWDDFSGHWTANVEEYAASINVVLLKVPPRYISWNKPLKSRFRALWIDRLGIQLREYRAGEKMRQQNREKLQSEIARVRKELIQEKADSEAERLWKKYKDEPFTLKPPSQADITEWVSTSWDNLSQQTIISSFAKINILGDTRTTEEVSSIEMEQVERSIVEKLESCNLADGHVDSDDDIEADDDFDSDSE